MAACYLTAVRTALGGDLLVLGRRLLTHSSSHTPAFCQCQRPLHVSTAALECSSRTGQTSNNGRAGEEKDEEPEYNPKQKAKNPMMKIGYAWMIGLPTGVISFILAKREVDKNRLKQLKVRQRMSRSNEGEYEGSRYLHHSENVNLER